MKDLLERLAILVLSVLCVLAASVCFTLLMLWNGVADAAPPPPKSTWEYVTNSKAPPPSKIFIADLEVPMFARITFSPQGDEIMTIHSDGRITVSNRAKPTETAKKVIEAMQTILMQQRKCEVQQ